MRKLWRPSQHAHLFAGSRPQNGAVVAFAPLVLHFRLVIDASRAPRHDGLEEWLRFHDVQVVGEVVSHLLVGRPDQGDLEQRSGPVRAERVSCVHLMMPRCKGLVCIGSHSITRSLLTHSLLTHSPMHHSLAHRFLEVEDGGRLYVDFGMQTPLLDGQ